MIQLHFPNQNEDRYLFWNNYVMGPFGPNLGYTGAMVEFNSTLRSLEQHRGLHGQNAVEHQKLEGEFWYHPMINGCSLQPSAQYPRMTKVPYWDYYHNALDYSAPGGLAFSGGTSFMFASTKLSVVEQAAFFQDPVTGLWTYWLLQATAGIGRAAMLYRYDFISMSWLSQTTGTALIKCRKRYWASSNLVGCAQPDWSKPQSFDLISHYADGHSTFSDSIVSTETGKLFQVRIPVYDNSPKAQKEKIDTLIGQIFPEGFPIPDYPYGDLAMRAINQIDSNHTNMIEFLKDLRHPTELIPKLRNLRNLKGIASTYLGVKFGILPTVSDLKTIVKAFTARDYFDKNGFKTYSAGETTNKIIGQLSYSLVQYIQVAVGREDTELMALVERLEDMGIMPDFEKIWDITPYSFVVDWFVDVGKLLKRVDTNLRILRLNIKYVNQSRKQIAIGRSNIDLLTTPFVGTIEWTKYQRWVSDQCPGPTLSLSPLTVPYSHWLEGGALVIQRL